MAAADALKKELQLLALISNRASTFPETLKRDEGFLQEELRRVCNWIAGRQNDEGLWAQADENFSFRFYADSYSVRALLAASSILEDPLYYEAAMKWVESYVGFQRDDGGWWVGYYDSGSSDKSAVYAADSGETTVALGAAYHFARRKKNDELAEKILSSLLRFRNFMDLFRLRSGAVGLGYSEIDFYLREIQPCARSFMQGHFRPFPFATVQSGINFNAVLFAITGDFSDWEKAVSSLEWCLEHSCVNLSAELEHITEYRLDIKHLHRAMDLLFYASSGPMDENARKVSPLEPAFRSPERQRIYSIWKYVLHLIAQSQSENGEWPKKAGGREIASFTGALRHRLFFLYSLTTYLENLGPGRDEDSALARARDRQFWLCCEPGILSEHYGVCKTDIMMPTGLWGMTLCEMLKSGSTLPFASAA